MQQRITIYRTDGKKTEFHYVKNIKDENNVLTFDTWAGVRGQSYTYKFKNYDGYEIYTTGLDLEKKGGV